MEGLQRTSAGLGSVIIDSQPLTVALLASLLFGERLGAAGIAGLFIGVAGLCLLEVPPSLLTSLPDALAGGGADLAAAAAAAAGGGGGGEWSLWDSGEWWMLLAAQSMAVGTVMVRWVARYCDPVVATGALCSCRVAAGGCRPVQAPVAALRCPLTPPPGCLCLAGHLCCSPAFSMRLPAHPLPAALPARPRQAGTWSWAACRCWRWRRGRRARRRLLAWHSSQVRPLLPPLLHALLREGRLLSCWPRRCRAGAALASRLPPRPTRADRRPAAPLRTHPPAHRTAAGDAGLLLYVSLLGSAASYGVFFYNASRGNLTALSSLTFLTPMFAAAGGYLALGETLTPLQLAGAGVTLGAVALINSSHGGGEDGGGGAKAKAE